MDPEFSSLSGVFENVFFSPLGLFFSPANRLHWTYLGTSLLIGILVLAFHWLKDHKKLSLTGLLAALFPKKIYTHPSAIVDYQFFYVNTIFMSLVVTPMTLMFPVTAAEWGSEWIAQMGLEGVFTVPHSAVTAILYTVLLAFMQDFALFLAHYLFHRVPWLWEFHKVHHTAEVLTPITVYRMHPVEMGATLILSGCVVQFVNGLFMGMTGGQIGVFSPYGLNLVFFLFFLLGYNLRHSHVWLDYGPFWSKWFVSPAMHQVHHSSEQRHWDKNMGFIFSCFDQWFNTLYIPKGEETFQLGIDTPDQSKFQSLYGLYVQPFKNIGASLPKEVRPAVYSVGIVLIGMGLWHFYGQASVGTETPTVSSAAQEYVKQQDHAESSVWLEDLTWQEVKHRIDAGARIAIIPTGGTEQNGPHMALGKHNWIVAHTAEAIAKTMGNVLIAPVIAYVPEGTIEPPGDHMRFSGTLSVQEATFESLLEDTARSLKTHGFQVICFLGDSAWNQAGQQAIANKLATEWKNDRVLVVSLGNYYNENGQIQWLQNQGIQDKDIGAHAGIRDTSELLAVHPQGIRLNKRIKNYDFKTFERLGVLGNPYKATSQKGQYLLELKISAAVSQLIQALKSHHPELLPKHPSKTAKYPASTLPMNVPHF